MLAEANVISWLAKLSTNTGQHKPSKCPLATLKSYCRLIYFIPSKVTN